MRHFTNTLLLLSILFSVSCTTHIRDDEEKDDKTYPLAFEKGSYETPLGLGHEITIVGGNRDYQLTVKQPDILDATIQLGHPGAGSIKVTGKKKGETTLMIRDNVTQETVTLTIKVVYANFGFKIRESHFPLFPEGCTLFLVSNPNRDFYVFDGLTQLLKGSYLLSTVQDEPYMTLTCQEGAGQITRLFDLDYTDKGFLNFLTKYLPTGFDFKDIGKHIAPNLILNEHETDKRIGTTLEGLGIPEGVLE